MRFSIRTSAILLVFMTSMVSCTTKYTSAAYDSGDYDYEYTNMEINEERVVTAGLMGEKDIIGHEGKSKISSSEISPRFNKEMLVYNASVSLTVRNQDSTMSRIEKLATKEDGYVVSKSNYKIVIRIDTKQMNGILETIMKEGKVDSKNISTRDVSDEYADVQIRLDNAEKARTRYLELLAKAENVEAALKVEKELERLNTEIDQLRGQLKKMEHDVRYSTITVNVYEKPKLGVLGYVFVGIGKGVKWLFVRG